MRRARTTIIWIALLTALVGMGPCREPDLGPAPPITPDPEAPIMPEAPAGPASR